MQDLAAKRTLADSSLSFSVHSLFLLLFGDSQSADVHKNVLSIMELLNLISVCLYLKTFH